MTSGDSSRDTCFHCSLNAMPSRCHGSGGEFDSGTRFPSSARTRRQKDHEDDGPIYPFLFTSAVFQARMGLRISQYRPSGVAAKVHSSLSTSGFFENSESWYSCLSSVSTLLPGLRIGESIKRVSSPGPGGVL